MNAHVNQLCKSASFSLRRVGQARRYLDNATTEKLTHALITSKLDQFNTLLYGLSDKEISKIQRIQNSTARLVTRTKRQEHITPVLRKLHCLPIKKRVQPGEYSKRESQYDDIMTSLPTLVRSLRLDNEEYFPTPQANRGLQALNRCVGSLSDGRISPVRFQLNQPISEVAKSTTSYIKRKSKEQSELPSVTAAKTEVLESNEALLMNQLEAKKDEVRRLNELLETQRKELEVELTEKMNRNRNRN
ncbi:uncharacterized protein [Montipora capricornis]|uniref:uncharacterized protein n=1 Tax=Montipora capricornis TaxID=246305 RepID=UPI0035F18963